MNASDRVLQLIVARFLCQRDSDLTWRISPYASKWAQNRGVEVSSALILTPSDEWKGFRDLTRCQELIHSRHEYFAECMLELVNQLPREVDRYTALLRSDEYRVLLVYAGREVYDFFVRDHRFGPPPRGKAYRSNLRAPMNEGGKRPDNAITGLRRKVARYRSLGADTTVLDRELERREAALRRGEHPMPGEPRPPRTPDDVAEALREAVLGPLTEKLDGELAPHELDRMRKEAEAEGRGVEVAEIVGRGIEKADADEREALVAAHAALDEYRARHPQAIDQWTEAHPRPAPGGGGVELEVSGAMDRGLTVPVESSGGRTGRWVDPRTVAALATVPVELVEKDE